MKNTIEDNNLLLKDRLFSLIETIIQCIKYQGFFTGLMITFHYIKLRFFSQFIKSDIYNFLGYKLSYLDINQVAHIFFEVFGQNIYYFKSETQAPVIIDIGANIGDSVIYFKWIFPKSKIYAFEPLPNAFNLLRKNIELNNFKNVHIYNFGLGDKESTVKLYSDKIGTSGSSTTNKKTSDYKLKSDIQEHIIKIRKLSYFKEISQYKKIDLIKIDIEGAEGLLLAELEKVLPKTEKIIMEFHVIPDISQNSFDKLITLLRKHHFRLSFAGFYRNSNNISNPFAFLLRGDKYD
jgi:FkbM family methyltransferase